MRPSAPVMTSGSPGKWSAPILLSVTAHLSLAAGYVLLGTTYTPPRPPSILAVEVVLMQDAPGRSVPRPAEPAVSVASAPSAPAEQRPNPRETRASQPAADAPAERDPTEPKPAAEPPGPPPSMQTEKAAEERTPQPEPVLATTEPAKLPPAPSKPMPQAEPAVVQVAVYAPLPKRKPVLHPRPISMTEKAAPSPTAASTASEPPQHVNDPADHTRPATVSPSEIASAASAGAATAKLIPPRYAAPGRGNPLPVYPRSARRRGIEGRLVLRVRVDASGRAETIDIIESSGHGLLDAAAERAVRTWRFEPARRAGIPVKAMIDVPVVFRFKD